MADDVQVASRRIDTSENAALIGMARMGADAFGYTADLRIDRHLAQLLRLRVSQLKNCTYCLNLHYEAAREAGIPRDKIDTLTGWWETEPHSQAGSSTSPSRSIWSAATSCAAVRVDLSPRRRWSDNADVNAARVILARALERTAGGPSVAARVVHEPRPVHRLDHRPHPRRGNPPGEMAQPVRVRRGRKLRDQLPGIVDQAHVQSTSTQIQSSVQHEGGPSR